ncbi:hypothetical protein [Oceanobacillus sojae]|uniref:hypothetical protein n=1 Tax=Oceanobacillus sojae TaxID=582851 RepID=UPI0021A5A1C6|nr:hypothetical protein [Oceanobacillus sojae]MCT1902983.1 hypothetical protein [Oceanobacillus sojae]
MKKQIKFTSCILLLLFITFVLVACSDNTNESDNNDSATNEAAEESGTAEDDNVTDDNKSDESTATDESDENSNENDTDNNSSEESDTDSSDDSSVENEESNDSSSEDDDNALSSYSSEEIEYARVWLQLGPNQDIDELYVDHVPAGTPLDPNDEENDVSYPEDVIQVSGSRIVDGMVTYSGNGDGTINVYNIPYGNRWYGGTPRPDDIDLEDVKEEMREMLENPELVSIDPGDDEKVKNIIEKMYIID